MVVEHPKQLEVFVIATRIVTVVVIHISIDDAHAQARQIAQALRNPTGDPSYFSYKTKPQTSNFTFFL